MNSVDLTDFQRLKQKLNGLNPKEIKKLHKKAMNDVGKVLVNETKTNLRGVTGRSRTKKSTTSKGSKKGSLEKGITSKVWKSGQGTTVTILGDYRLKWFEKGTQKRTTKGKLKSRYKKQKYTGQMNSSYFFKKAVDNKKETAINEIEKNFEKHLNKIWNKK